MKAVLSVFAALAVLILVSCTSSSNPAPSPAPSASPVPGASPTPSANPSIACQVEQDIAAAVASGAASAIGCTNNAAIQAAILAATGKANLCLKVQAAKEYNAALKKRDGVKAGADDAKKEKGAIGDVACPTLVQSLFAAGLTKVPAEWGCTGGTTVQSVENYVTTICEAHISF